MTGEPTTRRLGEWVGSLLVVVALLWLFVTPYFAGWLSRQPPPHTPIGWVGGGLLLLLPILLPLGVLRVAFRWRMRWAAVTGSLAMLLYALTALTPSLIVWLQ